MLYREDVSNVRENKCNKGRCNKQSGQSYFKKKSTTQINSLESRQSIHLHPSLNIKA